MKFYGRAEEVGQRIIEAFQSGNVPKPLAQVFIQRNVPMQNWSYLNQFSCLIMGCTDARGYEQWKEANRFVKKGQQARAAILIPLTKRIEDEETGEQAAAIYGFKGVPVFDVSQTEGEPLPEETEEKAFLDGLPLLAAARQLGLNVTTYGGAQGKGALGFYAPGRQLIGLGVENVSTWLHELLHAADDKLGNLKERGQHWRSEVVAELGGATLAVMLGLDVDADTGGAWEYIQRYATEAKIEPVTACIRCLDRIAQAINLILETAESIEAS